jgi:hypothetical protein
MNDNMAKRMSVVDLVAAGMGKIQAFIAKKILSDEEMLEIVLRKKAEEVAELRVEVRELGGDMKALVNPETPELEDLEELRAREQELVALGADLVVQLKDAQRAEQVEAAARFNSQMAKVAQELKDLRAGELAMLEKTYATLSDAYDIAFQTYQTAFNELEYAKRHAPAMLKAIAAYRRAVEKRDQAREQDAGSGAGLEIMDDIRAELKEAQAEHATELEIEEQMAGDQSVDDMLARRRQEQVDADILAEFQAAAGGEGS